MPGFLSDYNKVTRVLVTDDGQWWVDIKDHITARDAARAQNALIRPIMSYSGDGEAAQGVIDVTAQLFEMTVARIVDWNLTDENGVLLPLAPDAKKRESIELLPEEVYARILKVISPPRKKAGESESGFQKGRVARPKGDNGAAA